MDREIADASHSLMSLTKDEHHNDEQSQPLSEDGASQNFVGLTVKNLARFEGVRIMEDVDKSPNRVRQQLISPFLNLSWNL
jgi:hypothetical protein